MLTSAPLVGVSFQDNQGTPTVTLDRIGQMRSEKIFQDKTLSICKTWQASTRLFLSNAQSFVGPMSTGKIDYLNFSLFNKISFPHCQEMFAQDKKLTIVFYRFWRQKTFPYNPPLRPHWWDNSMNIKQNQRLFWSPDEALEQFVRGWLSEPRRSPSRNRHSFWHQLTDLFFVISFSWWNSKYFNSMGTQWLPIPRSSLPLTLADGGVVDCLTIVGF